MLTTALNPIILWLYFSHYNDHFTLYSLGLLCEIYRRRDRLGMIRRQVFHLSLRTRRRRGYVSNREFKPNRATTTTFLDDSSEPLLHFVDESCIDEDEDRSGGHFKRVRYLSLRIFDQVNKWFQFWNLNFQIWNLNFEIWHGMIGSRYGCKEGYIQGQQTNRKGKRKKKKTVLSLKDITMWNYWRPSIIPLVFFWLWTFVYIMSHFDYFILKIFSSENYLQMSS